MSQSPYTFSLLCPLTFRVSIKLLCNYKAVKSHDVCELWIERGTSVGMSKSAEIRMVNDTNEAFSRLLQIFEEK